MEYEGQVYANQRVSLMAHINRMVIVPHSFLLLAYGIEALRTCSLLLNWMI